MPQGRPLSTRPRVRKAFLQVLSETANVSQACAEANINRRSAYYLKNTDLDFAAEWEDALQRATDTLEAEARRRALEGCLEPVVSGGRLIMDPDDPSKPMMVRKFSDTLTVLLLKGHRPERFRERFEHTGKDGGPLQVVIQGDDAAL